MKHNLKTFLLMIILTGLFIFLGGLFYGEVGIIFGLVIALSMNFFMYWKSDKIAIKMTRSQPLDESEAPEIYEIVRKLSRNANMPIPKIYLTPSNQPNAFAAGRNPDNAVIALTRGIMNLLNREELEGVIAHELSHIKNRDTLISTIAAVLAGALMLIVRIGSYRMLFGGRRTNRKGGGLQLLIQLAAILLVPIAAMIIRMAISRSREYLADKTGATITGNPDGLANALQKMQTHVNRNPMKVNSAASHMFILNPLSSSRKGLNNLFSTHPPIEERINKLQQLRY